MKITVIGTGYVGLVSGTCFAHAGHEVVCVDIDENKVLRLQNGEVPIYEPGLEDLFKNNKERLSFTSSLEFGIEHAEIIFLALPTPPDENGEADLSYILSTAKQIAQLLNKYVVIVDKSTVPVGTAEKVEKIMNQYCSGSLFDVVSNPEFLREGVAIKDFLEPDRVVVGASEQKCFEMMKAVYSPFVSSELIIEMDIRSAEMTKYAANAYLASRITFMNEVANLCDRLGANVDLVKLGIGSDTRIGSKFLNAGIGYGGSCFPKDVTALIETADKVGYDFQILKSVVKVNDLQKIRLFEYLNNYYKANLANKNIALWGLAFKPNTDDIREAPSRYIIDALLEAGASIVVYDPEAMDNIRNVYGDKLTYANSPLEASSGADALLIITEWDIFKYIELSDIIDSLGTNLICDGRNIFNISDMKNYDVEYFSIGRPVLQNELI